MSSCKKRYANERPGERVANTEQEMRAEYVRYFRAYWGVEPDERELERAASVPGGLTVSLEHYRTLLSRNANQKINHSTSALHSLPQRPLGLRGHIGPEPEPPQESYLDTPAHGEGLIEKKRPKQAARRGKRRRLARPTFDPARPAFAPKGGLTAEGEFYAGGEEIPGELRESYAPELSSLHDNRKLILDPSEAEEATLRRPTPRYGKDESDSREPQIGQAPKPAYADPSLRVPAALNRAVEESPRTKPATPAAARAYLPKTLADPRVIDDAEALRLTPKAAHDLIGYFNQLRPLREYTVAAKLGLAKRGWYNKAAKAIHHLFGEEAPRFAALLAGTSPRVSVQSNLRKALLIWSEYTALQRKRKEAGRLGQPSRQEVMQLLGRLRASGKRASTKGDEVTSKADPLTELDTFDAHDGNIANALTADMNDLRGGVQVLSGPKVHSFGQNVLGHLFRVTLDVWEARKSRISQDALSGGGMMGADRRNRQTFDAAYIALSAKTRLAAQQLNEERFAQEKTWEPAEVQETGWSLIRALAWIQGHSRREARAGRGRPLFALEALSALTHGDVSANTDFATLLLNDPVCHKLIRRLRLGGALDRLREELARNPGSGPEESGRVASSLADPLDVAAAGAVARESGRHQGGFLSGRLKKSRKKPRRYAAPESAPQQATAGSAQFAPQAEPQTSVASTDSTDDSLSFAQAYQRAMSTEGQGWKKATEGVLQQLGITQHKSHIAIGDWEGSAEHSVLNILPGPPAPDKVRLAAAWYGLLGNQKAVLIFHHDPHGPDSTYQIEVPETDVNKVRQVLDHYGIKDRTVIPDKKGTKVVFTDFRREHRDKIASFAQHYNAVIHEAIGRGELIGGSTRTAARRAYREIIRAHEQGSAVAG